MNHATCARWARYAPGAVRAWYEANPGQTRGERLQVEQRLASVAVTTVTPGSRTVWAPFVNQPVGAWPEGFLVGVQAGPLAVTSARVPDRLVDQAWAWIHGLCGVDGVPPRVGVGYVDAPEGVLLDGGSPGFAVAVALITWLLERAPRVAVVVSATVTDATRGALVGEVDYRDEKGRVCALEAAGVDSLVAEREVDVASRLAEWFGTTWRRDLARALGSSALSLAMDAWSAYRAGRHAEAEPLAVRAIEIDGDERNLAYAWLVRGACRLHRGQTVDALADLTEAERRLLREHAPGEEPPDPWEHEELDAFLGIALVDEGRPSEAVKRLEGALDRLLRAPNRDRRWRLVTLQAAGTLHRARVFAGDLEGARDVLERVALDVASLRAERARCLGDLAEVCRRLGDRAAAQEHLINAERGLIDAESGARPRTGRFHRLYRARAKLDPAAWLVDAPNWSDWPQPAEILEMLLAPGEDLDAWMLAHGLQNAEGDIIRSVVYLGAAARRGGPVPDWAVTLANRLAELPGIEDGVAELARGVRDGRLEEFARRTPY